MIGRKMIGGLDRTWLLLLIPDLYIEMGLTLHVQVCRMKNIQVQGQLIFHGQSIYYIEFENPRIGIFFFFFINSGTFIA